MAFEGGSPAGLQEPIFIKKGSIKFRLSHSYYGITKTRKCYIFCMFDDRELKPRYKSVSEHVHSYELMLYFWKKLKTFYFSFVLRLDDYVRHYIEWIFHGQSIFRGFKFIKSLFNWFFYLSLLLHIFIASVVDIRNLRKKTIRFDIKLLRQSCFKAF